MKMRKPSHFPQSQAYPYQLSYRNAQNTCCYAGYKRNIQKQYVPEAAFAVTSEGRPEAFSSGNLSQCKRITSHGLNSFSYLFLKLEMCHMETLRRLVELWADKMELTSGRALYVGRGWAPWRVFSAALADTQKTIMGLRLT